jgi:hypothetical protein
MGWAGHFASTGKIKNAYCILVRNAAGKGLLGRPRHRWKNNNEVKFLVCRKGMKFSLIKIELAFNLLIYF